MAARTHYDVLGLTSAATTEEVRKAYHKLARQHHPDRVRDPVEKKKAEELFTVMTDAFNVLSDARRRGEYDEALRKAAAGDGGEGTGQKEARAYAKLAQIRLNEGNAVEAVRLMRSAVHLDSSPASYYALLAQAHEADRAFGDAVRAWEEAIKRESFNGKLYRQAGQCMERAKMTIRARKMYEQALKWDKNDAAASEALERLSAGEGKDEAKKAGLLGGLFKRS